MSFDIRLQDNALFPIARRAEGGHLEAHKMLSAEHAHLKHTVKVGIPPTCCIILGRCESV